MRETALSIYWVVLAIHIGGCAVLMFRFSRFCERIAKHQGIKAEEIDFWTRSSEGGITPFQTRQYKLITNEKYIELGNPRLVQDGHSLAKWFKLSKIATVVLIVALALIDTGLK